MGEALRGATLEMATELAALGRFSEARALLEAVAIDGESLDAIILRAKMAAQEGQFEASMQYWEQALALDPDNQQARDGKALASKCNEKGKGPFRTALRLVVASTIIVVLAGLVTLGYFAGRTQGRTHPIIERELEALVSNQQQLRSDILDRISAQSRQMEHVVSVSTESMELALTDLDTKWARSLDDERKATAERLTAQEEAFDAALKDALGTVRADLEQYTTKTHADFRQEMEALEGVVRASHEADTNREIELQKAQLRTEERLSTLNERLEQGEATTLNELNALHDNLFGELERLRIDVALLDEVSEDARLLGETFNLLSTYVPRKTSKAWQQLELDLARLQADVNALTLHSRPPQVDTSAPGISTESR